jgi:2-polyprenyl-3-methyl-5-hydroxy-6-metoxy-1,4-benzoquinol methylase
MPTTYSDGIFYKNNHRINPFIIKNISNITVGSSIDFGCGIGTNSKYLKSKGWQVLGVEIEDIAVEQAKINLDGNVLKANISTLDWETIPSCNLVLCNYVFQHIPIPNAHIFLDNLSRKVLPGGHVIMSVFQRDEAIPFVDVQERLISNDFIVSEKKEWSRWDYDHGPAHFHVATECLFQKSLFC